MVWFILICFLNYNLQLLYYVSSLKPAVDVTDGTDEDDELTVSINQKRERKDSSVGRKLGKDGPDAKPKKKPRVHVEVNTSSTLSRFIHSPFILFFYLPISDLLSLAI